MALSFRTFSTGSGQYGVHPNERRNILSGGVVGREEWGEQPYSLLEYAFA